MLEALVDKETGIVVLARDPGLPWGKREGREPGAPFYVVRLQDDDLEQRHKPGTIISFPYAEYEDVEVDLGDGEITVDRRMKSHGTRKISARIASDPLTFNRDRTLKGSSLINKPDLEEVERDGGAEIGSS